MIAISNDNAKVITEEMAMIEELEERIKTLEEKEKCYMFLIETRWVLDSGVAETRKQEYIYCPISQLKWIIPRIYPGDEIAMYKVAQCFELQKTFRSKDL